MPTRCFCQLNWLRSGFRLDCVNPLSFVSKCAFSTCSWKLWKHRSSKPVACPAQSTTMDVFRLPCWTRTKEHNGSIAGLCRIAIVPCNRVNPWSQIGECLRVPRRNYGKEVPQWAFKIWIGVRVRTAWTRSLLRRGWGTFSLPRGGPNWTLKTTLAGNYTLTRT